MTVRDAVTCEGGVEARTKVHDFLKKVENGLETQGELKVLLCQAAKMGEQDVDEQIYDFSVPLEEFVNDLVSSAESDAMDIGKGRVKYSVRVVGKQARCTFALSVPEREDEDVEDLDELPQKRGLISQQMRHNEAFAKIVVGQAREGSDVLREIIRDLRAENTTLKRREAETIKTLEELRSMQFARDLEVMKLHKAEQRKDEVAKILMAGAPILLTKLLGGGAPTVSAALGSGGGGGGEQSSGASPATGGPVQWTELELMLRGFIQTFNEQQLMQIAQSGLLSPVQFAAFRDILICVLQKDEAEKQAANATQPQESASP